jgi:hypothetical protein
VCRIQDCDPWELFRSTHHVARKEHQCMDCSRTIAKGERYHYATGLGDGRWDVMKLCQHCEAAAEWLVEVCNGYLYGAIGEELEEHWDEDLMFRSKALGMAVLGHKRRWRTFRRDGLMPVPHEVKLAAQLVMGPIRERERVRREVYDVCRDSGLPMPSRSRWWLERGAA